ncbi:MAG: protein-glutamate O-methyltransferase [Alphaproteobacteria bacterium]|jgi:chemotaxis protein methyltransferase CheR|nr:protein-glutamate O-methyltransferase [Alphaproteobacteria bacterium]MBO6629586.1 protein-glutamate O-methyltransferase [Alphaproteobacteria bacterium]MDF1626654.1 protein-glutamate O-methyltransferase [Parvibaculaceae bacterium]
MTPEEFGYLASFLKKESGLVLSENKGYLIESRLLPLARDNGLDSISALVAKMRGGASKTLLDDVTEAMTTNESFFFRDKTPFNILEETVLPALMKSRSTAKKLRIWCAAASTGQEPYSIAMILKEWSAKLPGWRFEIIGTDLSADVLRRAKLGKYTQFEVQRGLPIQMLVKYFKQDGSDWELSADIRNMVQYRKLNLLEDFSALGKFDIVFCRNVLIYFDQQTKGEILERTARLLTDDGYLFLGAAETVIGITGSFKPMAGQRGLYVPAGQAAKGAAVA